MKQGKEFVGGDKLSPPQSLGRRQLVAAWRKVKLGEVCVSKTGTRNPADAPDSTFSYVDITSVDNVSKRIVAPKELIGRDAPSRARQIIRAGDVLVSTTRPNLNAVALVPPELDGQIASTGFCVLRSGNEIDSEFLFSFVRTPVFVSNLTELTKGALYPAVNDKQVFGQFISLPPKDEQGRIAARLREQMAEVERARAAVQAQLDAAQSLPAALLRAIFTSPAAQRWPRRKLDELCEIVAKQVDPRETEYGNLPHVSGENIVSGLCRLINVRSATEDGMISGKYLFETGDVLYSKLRPYLRKVAMAESRGLCSADMYPLRVNPKLMDARFTAWMLLSEDFSGYAIEESQRSRMPKLNREQLFAYEAPVPPLAEQKKIAARLDAELTAARALVGTLETRLAEIELLPAALLRTAFRGGDGLVPV